MGQYYLATTFMVEIRLEVVDTIGTLITLTKEAKLDNFITHNVETGATLEMEAIDLLAHVEAHSVAYTVGSTQHTQPYNTVQDLLDYGSGSYVVGELLVTRTYLQRLAESGPIIKATRWAQHAAELAMSCDHVVKLPIHVIAGACSYFGLTNQALPDWSSSLPSGVSPLEARAKTKKTTAAARIVEHVVADTNYRAIYNNPLWFTLTYLCGAPLTDSFPCVQELAACGPHTVVQIEEVYTALGIGTDFTTASELLDMLRAMLSVYRAHAPANVRFLSDATVAEILTLLNGPLADDNHCATFLNPFDQQAVPMEVLAYAYGLDNTAWFKQRGPHTTWRVVAGWYTDDEDICDEFDDVLDFDGKWFSCARNLLGIPNTLLEPRHWHFLLLQISTYVDYSLFMCEVDEDRLRNIVRALTKADTKAFVRNQIEGNNVPVIAGASDPFSVALRDYAKTRG